MAETEQQLEELYDRAEQLRQAGRREGIPEICKEILAIDPGSPRALQFMSMWHLGKREFKDAVKYLKDFNTAFPNQEKMMLPFAIALEEVGDYAEAVKVLRRALKLNENNYFTYLYLGSVLEHLGEKDKAAWAYAFGVDLNPSLKVLHNEESLPKPARERVARSNAALKKVGQSLRKQAIAKAKEKFPKGDFSRMEKIIWRKLHDAKVGIKNPKQQPLSFFIPDLDRSGWFERDEFPWVKGLEKEFPFILKEVMANYRGDQDTLPYLQLGGYDASTWGKLVGSKDWAACHFYDGLEKKEQNCARFPQTVEAIDKLPLFGVHGTPVEALLSVLKPKTKIPPHFGNSNARLTVHLPLVVPDGCFLTVSGEERKMEAGKCLIFDDSFKHEARNDSDQVRVVLIVEVWHPDLKEEERAAIEESYYLFDKWMSARDHDALLNG